MCAQHCELPRLKCAGLKFAQTAVVRENEHVDDQVSNRLLSGSDTLTVAGPFKGRWLRVKLAQLYSRGLQQKVNIGQQEIEIDRLAMKLIAPGCLRSGSITVQ